MDYSYIGTGTGYVRKVGAAGPLQELGNASAITFGVTEDVKTLLDRTQPGGGTRNEVRRISSVDFSATLSDYSPNNLAIGFLGDIGSLAAGTKVDEVITVYKGGLNILSQFSDTVTAVKSADSATTYDPVDASGAGDYILKDGGLIIPEGSAIDDADSLKVSFGFGAKAILQALTQAAGIYEFYFPGFNEAQQGKRFVIRAYRVRIGATDQLGLITDDFGNLTIKGTVLKDDTQPDGLSQYFRAEMEQ